MAIDDPKPGRRARDANAPHYARGMRPKSPPKPLPEIPSHRNRERPFRDGSLLPQLIAKANGKPSALDRIAARLIKKALDGDLDAIKEIANRCDGQAPRVLAQQQGDIPMFLTVQWLAQPPAHEQQQVKVIDAEPDDAATKPGD